MKIFFSFIIFFSTINLYAQDEMSQEINKLETGNVENKKSAVPQDPTDSANQVEKELDQDIPKEDASAPQAPSEDQPVVEEKAPPTDDNAVQEIKPDQPAETTNPTAPVEDIVTRPDEKPAPPTEETVAPTPEPAPEPVEVATEPLQKETGPSEFEQRLNKIYNKFYAESTSDQTWTQIAGEKINETYTIQPGDTLWDVSVTFFGNGFYWPKVWSMNDEITNPHQISAGYLLKFTPGKMDSAPEINISKNDGTPAVPKAEAKPENVAKIDDGPLIPPPDTKYAPVLKDLPASLPFIRGPHTEGFDGDGFSMQANKAAIKDARVFLPSYLSEEEPERLGKVVEFEDEDQENGALYDVIYVRFENSVQPGDKFVTYHLDKKIHDFHGTNQGRPVVIEGEIQIMGLVNGDKSVYRAKILRSVNFVKQDSYVMKGGLVEGNLAETNDSGNIAAEIVGGDRDEDTKLSGDQNIVFLGKGSQEGVREGQIFDVYKNMDVRKSSTYVKDLKEKIARIKVIKTTPERSTAIILKATDIVMTGDFIGAKEITREDNIRDTDFEKEESKNSSEDLEKTDLSPDDEQKSDSDEDLLTE